MEYCGEVCTPAEFEERKKDYVVEKRRHYYFMSLKTDEVCLFGLMMVFCVTDGVCANVKGILCFLLSHLRSWMPPGKGISRGTSITAATPTVRLKR